MRSFVIALLFTFLVFPDPALAQSEEVPDPPPEKDSVTVSVESLRNLKEEFMELERTVKLQDSLIAELEHQTELYEERARQDSAIIAINEEKLEIKDERIAIRDEQIEELRRQNTWGEIKKFIWTAGGILLGFLLGSA